MSRLTLSQLDSTEQLRRRAAEWDDLWNRSGVTIPTARATLVAHWIEWFSIGTRLRLLVVERDGRMVAALPLAGQRALRWMPVGGLTMNYWSPNGELLLDPAAGSDEALDLLVEGINRLPWPLAWLDMAPVETPHWQACLTAFRRRGLAVDVHHRWTVGVVATDGDYESYLQTRSKNLRRNLRRDLGSLEKRGAVEFSFDGVFDETELEKPLRDVFELEDRGWKGAAGGSVLRSPGMFEFYLRQARQLAAWGDLRLARLMYRDQTIAFELGWMGKGVYHSFKVGYDPAYRVYGPGHLLREFIIRSCHADPAVRAVDFQGPPTDALASWATGAYPIARVVVAPRRVGSRILWIGYRAVRSVVRRLRRRPREHAGQPEAAGERPEQA
ncbi:MAG: GNAT family N-acetyltransferase [Pirellulales bacterium]|nr:GNAT family N-acetyltransferase [Pirellulales bacterium]